MTDLVDTRFDEFVENFNLQDESRDASWRRFVNYHFFSQFQPGRLDTDGDLLDQICVDSLEFSQVHGAFFLLNDQILCEPQDIDDILQKDKKGLLELYFLTLGDPDCFMQQIEKLLQDLKTVGKEEPWLQILACGMSTRIKLRWKDNPVLKVISYGSAGHSTETVFSDQFRRCFSDIDRILLDRKRLKDIISFNENSYESKMAWETSFPIPNEKETFDNAYIACVSANELINLMTTPDGLLRRHIFDDNVRDSQGYTTVNQEILSTLNDDPDRFVLFNNGITIVCQKISPEKGKYRLDNPQIVNGCQTCHMIYQAHRKGVNLEDVRIIAKIVESGSGQEDVTPGIVRGTNRQNIVYEEAFETIKEFHKDLEQYFECNQVKGCEKIYYERRSRQYADNVQIKPQQKIGFRGLIQSMVALFLNHVEESHRHEYTLLKNYKDSLFLETHSYQPYYLAAFLFLHVDALFREKILPRQLRSYKMHIMLLIKEMGGGPSPDLSSDDIGSYCERLLKALEDGKIRQRALDACKKFEDIRVKWIHLKGKQYQYGIKDSAEFRSFLSKELYGAPEERDAEKLYTGYVMNIDLDRHNTLFGFIEHVPENIFFHEFDNPDIDRSFMGKKVSYKIVRSGNQERAVHVQLVEAKSLTNREGEK